MSVNKNWLRLRSHRGETMCTCIYRLHDSSSRHPCEMYGNYSRKVSTHTVTGFLSSVFLYTGVALGFVLINAGTQELVFYYTFHAVFHEVVLRLYSKAAGIASSCTHHPECRKKMRWELSNFLGSLTLLHFKFPLKCWQKHLGRI